MSTALVVDDDALNCQLLGDICRALGFNVKTAFNGREAINAVRGSTFDVMLLDLAMPELDGLGVLDEMREIPLEQRPAVIVVTAAADASGRMRGTELGAIDFVLKPPRLEDLRKRILRAQSIVELERRLRYSEKALQAMRNTDETTGVGTFSKLYTILDAEFRVATTSSRPLSCILVSDESYSQLLTTSGAKIGAERLQNLTQILEKQLRTGEHLFRVDAAEFVILLPLSDIPTTTQRIVQITKALKAGGFSQHEIAIGAATYPNSQITQSSHLYRAANVALAQARSRDDERVVYAAKP